MHDQKDLIDSDTTMDWVIIQNEQQLKNWEYAWNNNQPVDKRIFSPNIFTQDFNTNLWSEICIFIKEKISRLPIVGYEKDQELVLALEAGFKTMGKLKILLKI